jgi:predicted transcriptional regulator
MDPQSIDPLLTATIVGSYVRHHRLGPDQLPALITSVNRALNELGQPNLPEEVLTPAVSVRQSVRHDYVVCLDCGYRGKTLRRHISTRHGLSRDEYLKRWGLQHDHVLTAPAYSERRSSLAKSLGLGRKPATEVAPSPTPTVSPPADADGKSDVKPTRRRRPRSGTKSDGVNEAVAAAMPARKRRPRSRSASPPQENPSSAAETQVP